MAEILRRLGDVSGSDEEVNPMPSKIITGNGDLRMETDEERIQRESIEQHREPQVVNSEPEQRQPPQIDLRSVMISSAASALASQVVRRAFR